MPTLFVCDICKGVIDDSATFDSTNSKISYGELLRLLSITKPIISNICNDCKSIISSMEWKNGLIELMKMAVLRVHSQRRERVDEWDKSMSLIEVELSRLYDMYKTKVTRLD